MQFHRGKNSLNEAQNILSDFLKRTSKFQCCVLYNIATGTLGYEVNINCKKLKAKLEGEENNEDEDEHKN